MTPPLLSFHPTSTQAINDFSVNTSGSLRSNLNSTTNSISSSISAPRRLSRNSNQIARSIIFNSECIDAISFSRCSQQVPVGRRTLFPEIFDDLLVSRLSDRSTVTVAVSRHRLSSFTYRCQWCQALHWLEEMGDGTTVTQPIFRRCCGQGQMTTIANLMHAPPLLHSLLSSSSSSKYTSYSVELRFSS